MPMSNAIVLIAALLASCLLTGTIALMLMQRQWKHPWQLKRPLFTLRHLTIEGDLLLMPRRMTAAHLPFKATAQPRLQSGALLWASAITVTHALAEGNDRTALLAAVKPLGFTPEKFLARCPILGEVQENGLRGYIVRDGSGQRAYFIGPPASLLSICTRVWEQQERDRTDHDALRLPTAAPGLYGLAMAPVENGAIGPMTYLGSVQVATMPGNASMLDALTDAGFQLTITPPVSAPEHTQALCSLSTADESPRHTLHIASQPTGENCYVVPDRHQADFPQQILSSYQQDRSQLRRMIPALCWSILWPCLIHYFITYAAGSAAPGGLWLGIIAQAAGFALIMPPFSLWRITIPAAVLALPAAWLILRPPALAGAFCLLAGLLQALIARLLLNRLECS